MVKIPTSAYKLRVVRFGLHKTYSVQMYRLRPIVILERAIVHLDKLPQMIKMFTSSIHTSTAFQSTSPIAISTSESSELQFAMSLEDAEASEMFVYDSCSADYSLPDFVCNGSGDQAEQRSFAGVKYLEAHYRKPQFPDVPVIKASGIATDHSQAFNALVKPVVFEQQPKDCKSVHTEPAQPTADNDAPSDSSDDQCSADCPCPPDQSRPSVIEMKEQLHEQALQSPMPFTTGVRFPTFGSSFASKAPSLDYIGSKMCRLRAAKDELQGEIVSGLKTCDVSKLFLRAAIACVTFWTRADVL